MHIAKHFLAVFVVSLLCYCPSDAYSAVFNDIKLSGKEKPSQEIVPSTKESRRDSSVASSLPAADDIHEKVRTMYREIVDKFIADTDTPAKLYKTIDDLSNVISIMSMTAKATPAKTLDTAITAFSLDLTAELMEQMVTDLHTREASPSSKNALEKIRLCRETTREGTHDLEDFARESGIPEISQLAAALQDEKSYALDYYAQRTGQSPKTENISQEYSPLTMTDELYKKFTENNEFRLSEVLLNTTWRYIKSLLSKSRYQEVLKEQQKWLKTERDRVANRYAAQMSDVEAYTKVNFERADELAKIINSQSIPGEYIYTNGDGGMTVHQNSTNVFQVEINTVNDKNMCYAEGIFDHSGTGWDKIRDDTPDDQSDDIYFLFLPQKVFVYTQMSSYCGMNASMDGEYVLQ